MDIPELIKALDAEIAQQEAELQRLHKKLQLLEEMKQLSAKATPIAWYVTGCSTMLDEHDAKAEAKRCGGSAKAVPLYTSPPAPAALAASDERKAFDAANLRDYFGGPLSYRERDIAFMAWQARAALAATPVADAGNPALESDVSVALPEPEAWLATFRPKGMLSSHSSAGTNLEELKRSVPSDSVFKPLYTRHATQQGMGQPIKWPKARDVGRFGDMSPDGSIRVGLDADNDVYVSICDGTSVADIEFCTPGGGGGRSSRTRMALIALMCAIEADNASHPAFDFWQRNLAAQAKQGGT